MICGYSGKIEYELGLEFGRREKYELYTMDAFYCLMLNLFFLLVANEPSLRAFIAIQLFNELRELI